MEVFEISILMFWKMFVVVCELDATFCPHSGVTVPQFRVCPISPETKEFPGSQPQQNVPAKKPI